MLWVQSQGKVHNSSQQVVCHGAKCKQDRGESEETLGFKGGDHRAEVNRRVIRGHIAIQASVQNWGSKTWREGRP